MAKKIKKMIKKQKFYNFFIFFEKISPYPLNMKKKFV